MKYLLVFVISVFYVVGALAQTCQVTNEFKDYDKVRFSGKASPEIDPAKGLHYATPKEVVGYLKNPDKYQLIDTRPASLLKICKIKKNVENLEYTYAGSKGETAYTKDTPKLTKEAVAKYISEGKKVVFFCNALKCHRSANAALHSVCVWGFPADKIIWYGKGVPGIAKIKKRLVKGSNCKYN